MSRFGRINVRTLLPEESDQIHNSQMNSMFPKRRKLFDSLISRSCITMLCSVTLTLAQSDLTEVTRRPDAYDGWKLALTPGTATDPAMITVPAGFKVEPRRSAPPEEDSWVSMAFDPQGRLTVAREKKGLLRMTLGASSVEKVEVVNDTLLECRGLLYAAGAFYANANNSKLFCRLRDTDGDDQFDQIDELLRTEGGVGPGRNHDTLGPDARFF